MAIDCPKWVRLFVLQEILVHSYDSRALANIAMA
jgi:hypothetical protein